MTAFLNKEDAYPIFRGRIANTEIVENYRIKLTALDAFGFLTGHNKATVSLTDDKNVDGMSVAAQLQN